VRSLAAGVAGGGDASASSPRYSLAFTRYELALGAGNAART